MWLSLICTKLSSPPLQKIGRDRKLAQAIRLQHAALHYAQRASAGPCHALQKSAAIDAVVVVIVQYFIFDRAMLFPPQNVNLLSASLHIYRAARGAFCALGARAALGRVSLIQTARAWRLFQSSKSFLFVLGLPV